MSKIFIIIWNFQLLNDQINLIQEVLTGAEVRYSKKENECGDSVAQDKQLEENIKAGGNTYDVLNETNNLNLLERVNVIAKVIETCRENDDMLVLLNKQTNDGISETDTLQS